MAIIISKNGKNAQKIEQASFGQEDYLQQYIYDNPDSIPLYEISEDIKLLILAREFPTTSGPIDAIGIDRNGDIYIVETKLYKNPDKRLVIAQILDYGASLWKNLNDFSEFIRIIDIHTNKQFGMTTDEKIATFFSVDEEEIAAIYENIKKNLNDGNFKFVVLVDKLHDRLRDLIVFINQNSQFDVFAVELEYYKHNDFEIIIPKLFGSQVKKDINVASTGRTRRLWNEELFWDDARNRLKTEQYKDLYELYDYFKTTADFIDWGSGKVRGTFNPIYKAIEPNRTIMTVYSDGTIVVNFGYLDRKPELQLKLYSLFSEKTNIDRIKRIKKEDLNHAYPNLTLEEFEKNFKGILSLLKAFVEKLV